SMPSLHLLGCGLPLSSDPHAAYGQQTARNSGSKCERVALSHLNQSSTTPGAKRRTKIGTEVHDHKNSPQGRPVKQRDSFGRYCDTTSTLRKTVDQYKGIQGPVGRRLTEDEEHHKTRDRTAHRHTKSAFAVHTVHQPAKEHASPQADQAYSARHRGGAQEVQPARADQEGDEMHIDHGHRDGHTAMGQTEHPECLVTHSMPEARGADRVH